MELIKVHKKWIALFVVIALLNLIEISTIPVHAGESVPSEENEVSKPADKPGAVEITSRVSTRSKKKHFPWIWVVLGVAAVAGATYLFFYYTQKFTLSVTKDEGVSGTPENGNFQYKRTEKASYNYSLKPGFSTLEVRLDGNVVSNSGSVLMNANHTLVATTSPQCMLTVSRGTGVYGTPDTGTYLYDIGTDVDYMYTTIVGYYGLTVTLDGAQVVTRREASP